MLPNTKREFAKNTEFQKSLEVVKMQYSYGTAVSYRLNDVKAITYRSTVVPYDY